MARTVLRWPGQIRELARDGDAFVATGSSVGAALVDLATGEVRRQLFTGDVEKVAIAGERAILAEYAAVHAVDLATGERVWTVATGASAHLAAAGGTVVTATYEGEVRAWDAATGAPRCAIQTNGLGSLLLHADGRHLLTVENGGVTAIWDLASGARVRTFAGDELLCFVDAERVAVGRQNTLAIVRLSDGECLFSKTLGIAGFLPAALLPDRTHMLVTDYSGDDWQGPLVIRYGVLDLASGAVTPVVGWTDPARRLVPWRAQMLDDTRAVVITRDGAVALVDLAGPARVIGAHAGSINGLLATGSRVVTGSSDGTIVLWDPADATPVEHTAAVTAILPHAGGFVTASDDGTLKQWSADGRCARTFTAGRGRIPSVARLPSGAIATCQIDEPCIRVWDLATGANRRVMGDTGAPPPMCAPPAFFYGKLGASWRIAALADGRLATTLADRVAIWDLATGDLVRLLEHPAEVATIIAHPDGRRVISACQDSKLRIWDVDTGEASALAGGSSVALAAHGTTLLAATTRNIVAIWDLASGTRVGELAVHAALVTAIDLTGERVLTGDEAGLLVLWDLGARRELARWQSDYRVTACLQLADGRVVRGDGTGALEILG